MQGTHVSWKCSSDCTVYLTRNLITKFLSLYHNRKSKVSIFSRMDSTNINFIQDTSFVVSHGSETTKEAILFIKINISFFRSRRWNLYRPSLIDEYFTWTEEHTFDLSDLMERRSLKRVSKVDYTSFISLSWWRENISLINHQSNFTQTV